MVLCVSQCFGLTVYKMILLKSWLGDGSKINTYFLLRVHVMATLQGCYVTEVFQGGCQRCCNMSL